MYSHESDDYTVAQEMEMCVYYESDNNTVTHPRTRKGMAPHEDGSMDAIPRCQFITFDDSLFPTKKTFEGMLCQQSISWRRKSFPDMVDLCQAGTNTL